MRIFSKSQRGAALVEYCVLVGLIAVVAIGSVSRLGSTIGESFEDVSAEMSGTLATAILNSRGQGQMSEDSARLSIYASACSSGQRSVEVEGDVLAYMNADGEFTFAFRRFTRPWTNTLNFGSPGEQEYYGEFQGVDSFGRYQYGQTVVYPPGWDPCIDDQGFPEPHAPPSFE